MDKIPTNTITGNILYINKEDNQSITNAAFIKDIKDRVHNHTIIKLWHPVRGHTSVDQDLSLTSHITTNINRITNKDQSLLTKDQH